MKFRKPAAGISGAGNEALYRVCAQIIQPDPAALRIQMHAVKRQLRAQAAIPSRHRLRHIDIGAILLLCQGHNGFVVGLDSLIALTPSIKYFFPQGSSALASSKVSLFQFSLVNAFWEKTDSTVAPTE